IDALVSRALMIRLSLQPSPDSETSAFNNMRAFSSRCAGLFPFRISASSCSRSSPLNRTTYLFTEISFAAMIASVVHTADEANHQILSIWLKRATRGKAPTRPCVGFLRGVANKPHAAPALSPLSLPEGPGSEVMVLHVGTASVKPETSCHPSAPRLSDAFAAMPSRIRWLSSSSPRLPHTCDEWRRRAFPAERRYHPPASGETELP